MKSGTFCLLVLSLSVMSIGCPTAYPPSSSVLSGNTQVTQFEAEERAEANRRCASWATGLGVTHVILGSLFVGLGIAAISEDAGAFGAITTLSGAAELGIGVWEVAFVAPDCSEAASQWDELARP